MATITVEAKDFPPGTIAYIPSWRAIAESSVLYHNLPKEKPKAAFWKTSQVLIIGADPIRGTVDFLPIIEKKHTHTKESHGASTGNLIWSEYVLINEAWDSSDLAAQRDDDDYHHFIQVELDPYSFRSCRKHLIIMAWTYRIEIGYLAPCPTPSLFSNGHPHLPNPRMFTTQDSIRTLQTLAKKFTVHSPFTPASSNTTATVIQVGHIYRLPLQTTNTYLNLAQRKYSFFERPLGKPFLVTSVITPPAEMAVGATQIEGFVLTSFNDCPITMHFCRQDPKTRWIRAQYLPMEGRWAETHDDVPIVLLAKGSKRMLGRWYVNVLKRYTVQSGELKCFAATGSEVVVGQEMVEEITRYGRALRQGARMEGVDYEKRLKAVEGWSGRESEARDHGQVQTDNTGTPKQEPSKVYGQVSTWESCWSRTEEQVLVDGLFSFLEEAETDLEQKGDGNKENVAMDCMHLQGLGHILDREQLRAIAIKQAQQRMTEPTGERSTKKALDEETTTEEEGIVEVPPTPKLAEEDPPTKNISFKVSYGPAAAGVHVQEKVQHSVDEKDDWGCWGHQWKDVKW